MKKNVSLLLSLCLSVMMLASCGKQVTPGSLSGAASSQPPAASSSAVQDTLTVTDMMGRNITIQTPVDKVVALTAAECEILYALGAEDILIGRGSYCDYPPEALSLPALDSGFETNIEQIIALEPQVVFMSSMNQRPEQVEQLEKAGIAVIVNEAASIEDVYTSIELVGAVAGKDKEAAALVNNMKNTFASLAEKVPEEEKGKSIYFEVSPLEDGLWTAGKSTFMDEIAILLGLENIFSDVEGWAQISEEQVLERDPDYIITIAMYSGSGPLPNEEITARSSWQAVTAVAGGNVFSVSNDELSRPGPRLADAAQTIYSLIYEQA